jgi:hypothetical protein
MDRHELEGAVLDYTFGVTTANGVKLKAVTGGDKFFTLDLKGLTGTAGFTTTITVKTAD